MKKVFQFSLLILALLCFFNADAYGQKKKKKGTKTDQYFDESGGFGHHLWYGGNMILNFNGGTDIFTGVQYSTFVIGASPMVGYKIFDQLSVGPRVSLSYYSYREKHGGGRVLKANPLLWSVGAFTRYKIIKAIFLHAEYEYENAAYFTGVIDNKIQVSRRGENNFYLGGGYNSSSGGPWGYEISILFNVNAPENSVQQPFDIRMGVNYNF